MRLDAFPQVDRDGRRRGEADGEHRGRLVQPDQDEADDRVAEAGHREPDHHPDVEHLLGARVDAHQDAHRDADRHGEREAPRDARERDREMRQHVALREVLRQRHRRHPRIGQQVGRHEKRDQPPQGDGADDGGEPPADQCALSRCAGVEAGGAHAARRGGGRFAQHFLFIQPEKLPVAHEQRGRPPPRRAHRRPWRCRRAPPRHRPRASDAAARGRW